MAMRRSSRRQSDHPEWWSDYQPLNGVRLDRPGDRSDRQPLCQAVGPYLPWHTEV
jgi:hypothetical protein